MLYHVRVLEELGETSEALAVLDVNAKSRTIVDRTAIREMRGTHIHMLLAPYITMCLQRACYRNWGPMKQNMHGVLSLNIIRITTTIIEDFYLTMALILVNAILYLTF